MLKLNITMKYILTNLDNLKNFIQLIIGLILENILIKYLLLQGECKSLGNYGSSSSSLAKYITDQNWVSVVTFIQILVQIA